MCRERRQSIYYKIKTIQGVLGRSNTDNTGLYFEKRDDLQLPSSADQYEGAGQADGSPQQHKEPQEGAGGSGGRGHRVAGLCRGS
jgi:hypothetical protein